MYKTASGPQHIKGSSFTEINPLDFSYKLWHPFGDTLECESTYIVLYIVKEVPYYKGCGSGDSVKSEKDATSMYTRLENRFIIMKTS